MAEDILRRVVPGGGSMRSSMRALRGERRRDDGAAAVEFALLVPIFVLLTFGMLSGGISLWKHIADIQGARDGGRYGSTLPISSLVTPPTGSNTATQWVDKVRNVTMKQIWGVTGTPASLADNGYLCVAFVRGSDIAVRGNVPTRSSAVGTAHAGYTAPAATTDPCIPAASESDTSFDRVQVVVIRDGSLDAVLIGKSWQMPTAFTIRYERPAL
jgi:Flp pilus assembly protein TadG